MVMQVRIQLQNALDEAREALRASQQDEGLDEGAGHGGSYMTASAAAGGMDLGEAESGDECESKPSGIHVREFSHALMIDFVTITFNCSFFSE